MSSPDIEILPSNLLELPPAAVEALMGQLIDMQLTDGRYFPRSEGPGIEWRDLHLPQGTKLRSRRQNGTFCFGFVMDGSILVDMRHHKSMEQALAAMCGAPPDDPWRSIEIRRPGDDHYRPPAYLSMYQVPADRWKAAQQQARSSQTPDP